MIALLIVMVFDLGLFFLLDTQNRALHRTLVDLAKESEERMAMESSMRALMAHEVRGPANGVHALPRSCDRPA